MKNIKFRLLQNLMDEDEILLPSQKEGDFFSIENENGNFSVRGIDTIYNYNIYELEKNNIIKILD